MKLSLMDLLRISKICLLIGFILICFSNGFGQVNEINKELERTKRDNQSSSSSSSLSSGYNSSSSCNSGFLLFDLFRITGLGLVKLQKSVLSTRDEHPEIVSLEGFLQGGYLGKFNGILLNPQVRANWGVFTTEFRAQSINDNTGLLSTLDWQVVKMNIPIYPVLLNFGMGLSKVLDSDRTFVEYSLGGKVRFLKDKALTEVTYRTTDGSGDLCFRKEIKVTCDYEVKRVQVRNKASFRISPTLGFMYQNYYGTFEEYFLLGGLTLRYF